MELKIKIVDWQGESLVDCLTTFHIVDGIVALQRSEVDKSVTISKLESNTEVVIIIPTVTAP